MATILGTVYMQGCNYQLQYDLLGQDIANNTSRVRFYGVLNVTNNYVSWSRGKASVYTAFKDLGTSYSKGSHTVITADFTFTHDQAGKFSSWIGAGIHTTFVNGETGGTLVLPDIPRQANITSAPNFNDEQNPTIKYSNPAGNNVSSLQACISLTGVTDDIKYRDISKTGSSYTFNLTTAERNVLRKASKDKKSLEIQFFIKTIIGGKLYASIVKRTVTIVNANPTIAPTVEDTNSVSIGLTGDKNKLIRYVSDASTKINSVAYKYATIIENIITNGSAKTTQANYTFNKITSDTFSFSTKDSRKNVATKTIKVPTVAYILPTCSIYASNPTAEGNLNLKISGNCFKGSFGKVTNTITIQYRQKEEYGEYGEWITVPYTQTSNTYNVNVKITGLDYKKVYTYEARVIDKINTATSDARRVKTTAIYDWSAKDFRINVDTEINGKLTVQGKELEPYPVGSVYFNVKDVNPATYFGGGWQKIANNLPFTVYTWQRLYMAVYRVLISVKGKSYQATRQGYNLYKPWDDLEYAISSSPTDVEILENYDGYTKVLHTKKAVQYITMVNTIDKEKIKQNSKLTIEISAKSNNDIQIYYNGSTGYISLNKTYKVLENGWKILYATYNITTDTIPKLHIKTLGEVYIDKMQILVGETPKDIEPYGVSPSPSFPSAIKTVDVNGKIPVRLTRQGYDKTFNLSSGIMASIDAKDEIKDGTLTRRIDKMVLTGNEDIPYLQLQNTEYILYQIRPKTSMRAYSKIKSNYFTNKPLWNVKTEGISAGGSKGTNIDSKILLSRLTTPDANGVKKWLKDRYNSGNPVTIYYELAKPITKTLEEIKVPDTTDYDVTISTNISTEKNFKFERES